MHPWFQLRQPKKVTPFKFSLVADWVYPNWLDQLNTFGYKVSLCIILKLSIWDQPVQALSHLTCPYKTQFLLCTLQTQSLREAVRSKDPRQSFSTHSMWIFSSFPSVFFLNVYFEVGQWFIWKNYSKYPSREHTHRFFTIWSSCQKKMSQNPFLLTWGIHKKKISLLHLSRNLLSVF